MELNLLGDGNDPGRVQALMYFPTSPEIQQQFLVRHICKRACDDGEANTEVSLRVGYLRDLIEGPGFLEMKLQVEAAVKRGSVAGDLLHLVYEMHARGVPEPSFGKAIDEYKKFALGRKYGDGEALKYSERMLRLYFAEYESVAHIWAAFRLNRGPYKYTEHPEDVFGSPAMFQKFLGVAKAIGDFAASFIPKRTKPAKSVISPEILVRIPDGIPPVHLTFG